MRNEDKLFFILITIGFISFYIIYLYAASVTGATAGQTFVITFIDLFFAFIPWTKSRKYNA